MKKIKLSLYIFLTYATHCFAQSYVYKHYTREHGLAGNMVYCTSQDKDGFIWFGTENGASRFDGKNFTNFTTEDGLTDNEVLEVYSDKKGRTWFVCFSGGLCYYYKGKIYSHKNDPKIPQDLVLSKMAFNGFYEDALGTVWFLSDALWGYNENINLIPKIPELMDMHNSKHYDIGVYKNKSENDLAILISERYADNGILYTYDGKKYNKRIIHNLKSLTKSLGSQPQPVLRRYSAPGFILFNLRGNYFSSYKITGDSIKPVYEKVLPWEVTRIYPNTKSGTHIVSTYNHGVKEVNNNFEIVTSELFKEKISSALLDRDGNLWITTLGNGFYYRSKSQIKFYNETNGLAFNDVKSLSNHTGNGLYIGFKDGNVQGFTNNLFSKKEVISDFRFSFNNVRNIIGSTTGETYFGTDRSFAKKLINGRLKYYSVNGALKDHALVNDSILLYASHIGVFISFPDGNIDTVLFRRRATNLCSANKPGFNHFVSTIDTLYYLNNERKLSPINIYNFKKYGRITDLEYSNDSILYIASYNSGLYCLIQNRLIAINETNGLISNQIRNIYIENDSKIWLLTNMGVSRIEITDRFNKPCIINNFTHADGFSSDLFTDIVKLNDTIYLGTDKGLNFFNENQLSAFPDHSVQVTSFQVNNKPIDIVGNPIKVNYGDNVKIKYNGISFSSSDFLTYKYFLTGFNPAGLNSSLNEIELPALPPGSYWFKVYSINKNNILSKEFSEIAFEIVPLWWQTLWFKFLVVSIISGLLYLFFNHRLKVLKKRETEAAKINKQFAELKLEAVRSQMDPHFIFNCLNAIQHFNIKQDYKSSQYYMAEFAKLIRKTLSHSHRDFVLLVDEIELLEIYIKLEKLRFEDIIDYKIELSDEINTMVNSLYLPSLIIQPFVENAINHGLKYRKDSGGKLNLSFSIQNKRLLIILDDNGIGVNASRKLKETNETSRESYGIKLNDSQINVINKIHDLDITYSITDKSTISPNEQGTLVQISLPLKYNY